MSWLFPSKGGCSVGKEGKWNKVPKMEEIRGQKDKDAKTKFILILEKKFFFSTKLVLRINELELRSEKRIVHGETVKLVHC